MSTSPKEDALTISEAAKRLRRSVKTLQRWDREGLLKAKRTPGNRRFYTQDQVLSTLGLEFATPSAPSKHPVVYCRVSSAAQRPELKNQRAALEMFCAARGFADVEYIEEIGGGLNFKRPKFLALLDRISNKEISTLVVAHKDRLTRFGFDLMRHLCARSDCEVLVLNQESLSPEQEMVQDLMTIVHCFSARLYGLRNYKKSLEKALAVTASEENLAVEAQAE